ncbi:hypothetical protein CLG94_06300 [Candidatus Methylomirabilis limnetica]|uniref:Uncharacterized protein n=1 Tax=Candidatus Methylomirabilis limnetica TaxID=2033718 RepID=A0A2T4TYQ6_9BACT|nr:hypothetical protein [Candidatus Methylomirabilis limnetica]PTL36262.1 hypothetical protein CLG94_06300 [Candidatus Methylomirabilis limnetica]
MRGVTDVTGLRDIRSLHTTGQRAIPRRQGSTYLELYMLRVEKGRLDKEAALLAKRSQGIQKRLSDIHRQMEDLERPAQSERPSNAGETATARNAPAKKWKTFSMNY